MPRPAPGRACVGRAALLALALSALSAADPGVADGTVCVSDAACGAGARCFGAGACATGVCVPAFHTTRFPVGLPGAGAYTAPIFAVLDHAGFFYTQCCDTRITAFTGESAVEGPLDVGCPAPPELPACLLTPGCTCGYRDPGGGTFVVNGHYVGTGFGTGVLSYDGHAGYDYAYAGGTPLVALADGTLCKAVEDPVNGHAGAPTAWDRFHTFFVDHGAIDGVGHASWYLHATDLVGQDLNGASLAGLAPGGCGPVAAGQVVATVGNVGTGIAHLHFEVRTYMPGEGAEGPSARVIDPYGWRGATSDPWEDPAENPQAAHRADPLWIACGNGRVECGEECDDGNTLAGDCCAADCRLEVAGAGCDDGDACTSADACDGGGSCAGVVAPAPTCRDAGRSTLVVRDRFPDARDVVTWKWRKGAATGVADFGDPVGGATGYDLCVYDEAGGVPSLVMRATVPAGGVCGPAPCWKAAGGGYRYKDRAGAAGGVRALTLKPGAGGKATIVVKGKGEALAPPPLPLAQAPRVTVQLARPGGICWRAVLEAPAAGNDAARFKDGF